MSESERAPINRRWLLRISGLLGLSAGGMAISGASSAAPDPGPAGRQELPDPTGAFGLPATAETAHRQRQRAGQIEPTRVDIGPGVAKAPDSVTAAGAARLTPNTGAINHTPLTRRQPQGPWTTGR